MYEFIYVIFLISGMIKSFLNMWLINIPIDLTFFFGLLLTILIIFNSFRVKLKVTSIFAIFLLLLWQAWTVFTLLYSVSSGYAFLKTVKVLANTLAFIYPIFLCKNFNTNQFFKSLIYLTTPLNLFYVFFILPYIYQNESFYEQAGLYLSVGFFSGLNILISIRYLLNRDSLIKNFLSLFLNFLALILSGARGPLLLTVACVSILTIYLLLKKGWNKKILILKIIFIIGIMGFVALSIAEYFNSHLVERTLERLSLLVQFLSGKVEDFSSKERIERWIFVFSNLNDIIPILFGYGLGSFGIMYLGEDIREYPHNIILEVWFETGLVGLFIFLAFLLVVFLSRRGNFLLLILTFYIFANFLKSGSLADARILFAFLSILMVK